MVRFPFICTRISFTMAPNKFIFYFLSVLYLDKLLYDRNPRTAIIRDNPEFNVKESESGI